MDDGGTGNTVDTSYTKLSGDTDGNTTDSNVTDDVIRDVDGLGTSGMDEDVTDDWM